MNAPVLDGMVTPAPRPTPERSPIKVLHLIDNLGMGAPEALADLSYVRSARHRRRRSRPT